MNKMWVFEYELTQTGIVLCYSTFEYAAKQRKRLLPKWNGKDEVQPSVGACLGSRNDNMILIWIANTVSTRTSQIAYVMTHECVHAAFDVMDICGLSHSPEGNSEMEAYAIEWFCRKCWGRLQTLNRKPKKKQKGKKK